MTMTMAYHGKTYLEAQRTTIREFYYLEKADRLKRQRVRQDIHLLAWKMNEAQATKERGGKIVPLHRDYVSFYNAEEDYYRSLLGEEVINKKKGDDNRRVAFNNKLLRESKVEESNMEDIMEQNKRIEDLMRGK